MFKASNIFLLSSVFLAFSCQSNSEMDDVIVPETPEVLNQVDVSTIEAEQIQENTLFYDSYSKTEILASRKEMSDILEKIGAAKPNEEEFELINVIQTQDGYTGYDRICDERYNGSLRFLIGSGGDELEEFYGFYEPFFEFQGQDLFLYTIKEIFVRPNDEKITLTVRSIHQDSQSGNYYTDMSDPTEKIEIWQDFEYGTVAHYGSDFYLDTKSVGKLNTTPCPEFEH